MRFLGVFFFNFFKNKNFVMFLNQCIKYLPTVQCTYVIYCAEYGSRRNRQFKIVNFKLPIIIINSINSKSSNIVVNCQIKIVNFCLLVMTVNLKLSIIDRLPHSGNVILQSFKTAKGLIVTIKRVYTIQYTYTYCILSKIGKLLQNYFQSVRLSLKL